MTARVPLYGVMAEFADVNHLIAAIRKLRQMGYRRMDAFTPFPVEEVWEELGVHRNLVSFLVFCGGLTGFLFGIGLQYWTSVIAYPINVGGRPLFSIPAFVPITFECTVLFAALTAVLGMLALNGLPAPYHPVFNVPRFALASRDRFFLCVEATDPLFDREGTRRVLESLSPVSVAEVPD